MSDDENVCYQCGSPGGTYFNLCPECLASAGNKRERIKKGLTSSGREKNDKFEKLHKVLSDKRVRIILVLGILYCLYTLALAIYDSYLNATYVKPKINGGIGASNSAQSRTSKKVSTPTPVPTALATRVCISLRSPTTNFGQGNDVKVDTLAERNHQELRSKMASLKESWIKFFQTSQNDKVDLMQLGLSWDDLIMSSILRVNRQSEAIKKNQRKGALPPAWLDEPNINTELGCTVNAGTEVISYSQAVADAQSSPCSTTRVLGGIYFFNSQGANIRNGQIPTREIGVCESGGFGSRATPISFLMNDGFDIESELSVAQFPLEKDIQGHWYIWKGSKQAPLLVYDPQYTGNISSAEQLFGPWAFGGRLVGGGNREPWDDGYKALAALDRNGDKKLTEAEIRGLALWFDENKDGVSQFGEVSPVGDAGIETIYFTPNKTDPVTGNIIATKGFDQRVKGNLVTKSSVDWQTFGAPSKSEAQNAIIAPLIAGAGTPQASVTNINDGKKVGDSTLSGVWEWSSAEVAIPGLPQSDSFSGFLTFNELEDGSINGHSYSMFELERDQETTISKMLAVRYGHGKKISADGQPLKYEFELRGAAFVIKSEIIPDPQTGKLNGTSKATFMQHGTEVAITYAWNAVRLP